MLAVTGAKIITMAGGVLEKGTLLVDNGIIRGVERGIAVPAGASCVDASGKVLMPGLIDAHSHVGIVEEIYREEGDDCNEITDPVTPHLRAIDAVDPADLGFCDALAGGVTTLVTGPGSANVIGGEMVAMKTCGKVLDTMIRCFPAGLKAALGENPKRSYGSEKKAPSTRMASAAILREALVQGCNYLNKKAKGTEERDLKMEALARVLNREVPLRVHAHRADDIMTALRVAREFDLKLIIEHCTEGHLIAPELAEQGVPAVVGPVITNRSKAELGRISLQTAKVLEDAGVLIAIMTDHPVVPIQYLTVSAAMAVRGGLSIDAALRAITINAAKIIGLDKRLGSLEPGKEADFIIMDRHPLDYLCHVEQVYISGEKVYSG